MTIPFNKPFLTGQELKYIAQAVSSGDIHADGMFTQKCSEFLESRFGIHRILMTPSCTAALEMAAILCELGPDDEVIMPSFTFVSTANAVVRTGARPVFVDIRSDTLNIDESAIEAAISPRTKAVFVVHYAGIGSEMDTIMELARDHQLLVVEDAAQGVNANYHDRPLGSIGDLATFSFHETKNYICGEGGALCINRPELVDRAHIIRDKGTNRRRFANGEVDKYSWQDIGGSYVPSEIVCAFLLAQLEAMDEITDRRHQVFRRYRDGFLPFHDDRLQSPFTPDHCRSNFHMFYLLLADQRTRDVLIKHLRTRGIQAVFHYVPLHDSEMGRTVCGGQHSLPVTESVCGRLVRLPFFSAITADEQQRVIDHVLEFLSDHWPVALRR